MFERITVTSCTVSARKWSFCGNKNRKITEKGLLIFKYQIKDWENYCKLHQMHIGRTKIRETRRLSPPDLQWRGTVRYIPYRSFWASPVNKEKLSMLLPSSSGSTRWNQRALARCCSGSKNRRSFTFGNPCCIISYRGTALTSSEFREYCVIGGDNTRLSQPEYPGETGKSIE